MTHLDLCSGLAAWTLAAHELGIKTIGFSETDPRCCAFLESAWPGIPNYGDISTIKGLPCTIITAGFPCQPYSRAGKRGGNADDRAIWPQVFRVVQESNPLVFVGENVPGIRELALDGVLDDLEGAGYETGTFDIPACAVDSPQLRHRYYIVGFAVANRERARLRDQTTGGEGRARINERRNPQSDMADTGPERCRKNQQERESQGRDADWRDDSFWSNSVWLPCADGKLRRAPDDTFLLADGLHRSILGALGNSQVPQIARIILGFVKESLTYD